MLSSNTSAANGAANYIEDVFSTWLYSGAAFGSGDIPIPNGIDLSGEGGLVWTKGRSVVTNHFFTDTVRGGTKSVFSNLTNAEATNADLIAFNNNGFTLGSGAVGWDAIAGSGKTYASWTFRKQPKFFDVVTYTGNGAAGRQIAHNLGSVPGVMIVKSTSASGQWPVYHRSTSGTPQNDYLLLNQTAGAYINQDLIWNNTAPTSTVFTVGSNTAVNANGVTYVAYLFAHNAGGFGLTGTDNVISCGSFTTDGSGNATVDLGHEPQFVITKRSSSTGDWWLMDVMRGMPIGANNQYLNPNLADAEGSGGQPTKPSATGFTVTGTNASSTFIYIAIRRGPMKTPTTGTSVFAPIARTGTGASAIITTGFPVDSVITADRPATWSSKKTFIDRLRGSSQYLVTSFDATSAERSDSLAVTSFASNTGISVGADTNQGWINYNTGSYITYLFRRAPGFFDEICFSGTGANKTETHNLGVPPELWLVKSRSGTTQWVFGSSLLAANEKIVMPSPNGRVTDATVWNSTYPTASALSLGTSSTTNASGQTFVGYMWATVAGVSKVGMYTGNGTSQTIDCGFTGGARFVMIIRATASTAQDIYIWDSARGIVAGNDPRLSLNTTAAEVTSLDTIDTAASGFVVNTDASNVNVNGAVYLYLSIA